MAGINRIDNMSNRLSTNVTVGRQSQGVNFGERVSAGLQNTGSAIASGAAMVGGALPGGSIISAAVSSVSNLSGGSRGGSASSAYAATGALSVGGTTSVGASGGVSTGTTATSANLSGGASSSYTGTANTDLAAMTQQNAEMMKVQMAVQQENQMFSSVSNVLKTKHDTVKNTISNVR
jgi:hypothetical protein